MGKKIIVLDTETTGLVYGDDEILQISIIDGKENVLLNKYIKPINKTEWPDAQRINCISPDMVKDKHTADYYKERVKSIINGADVIIGYNISFDLNMLSASWGIEIPADKEIYDVMTVFAEIYGEWNEQYGNYKWQKLTKCADYYGYEYNAHDSLEDVKATLFCYNQILSYNQIKTDYINEI